MWDELGIAPSDDPKAIRRAYAARLKTLDLDRDAAAFARLRAALEWALAEADRPRDPDFGHYWADDLVEPGDMPPTDDAPSPRDLPPAAPNGAAAADRPASWLDLGTHERKILDELQSAIVRGDAGEAAKLYCRAAAIGAVALQDAPAVLERLFALAIAEPLLERTAFRALARSFGWDKPDGEAREISDVRGRVLARLAAEEWYDALVATMLRRKGETRRQARVARLMLGKAGRFWRPRIDRAALKAYLDQYQTHAIWLRDRIDPAWVYRLEIWWRRREIVLLTLMALFLAAFLADGVGVFVVDAMDGTLPGWAIALAPAFLACLLWLLKLAATTLYRLIRAPPRDPRTGPPEEPEARLIWLERQAELACAAMYDAPAGSPAAARYNDAKEFLHEAIALARRLGHVAAAERLSLRLAEIKAIARAQLPAE